MKERNNPLLKRLDFYLGVPLLFIIGLFRRKRKPTELPKTPRVALIKTNAIGDSVLLAAIVDEVKREYPRSRVTVVCSKTNEAMIRLIRGVDNIEIFAMGAPIASLWRLHRLPQFDRVLDFGPWPRINAVIALVLRTDFRVGFRRAAMYRHYIYDAYVEHSDALHEIGNYRNVLRIAGFQPVGLLPHFVLGRGSKIQEDYIIFHLFPGGAMEQQRMWATDNWVSLGKILHERYGATIVLTGGKVDRERAESVARELSARGVRAESAAGHYDVGETMRLLASARLTVSVNTGIMHLAAAVGVPLIALHGPTSEKRWGPLSDRAISIASSDACRPCISLGFESRCTNPICMEHIDVDSVAAAIERVFI